MAEIQSGTGETGAGTVGPGRPEHRPERGGGEHEPRARRAGFWRYGLIAILLLAVTGGAWWSRAGGSAPKEPSIGAPPPPQVTVSIPVQRTVAATSGFLGQFSAVDRVEIRAQVGGTLSAIDFKDGQIVHKGDLLFVIDTRPYEIKLAEAKAAIKSAQAKLIVANAELWRAQQLKKTTFGTAENVDQRQGDAQADVAELETAAQSVQDAELDLDYCHVRAPFTGRISNHLVSIGNLVSGSRAGASATTLLTTIVSLDPIYLDFEMSENDYLAFERAHGGGSSLAERVPFRLSDETVATRHGTLDFVDNAIDRSSGTIHARATVSNPDLLLVPGAFARLTLATGKPAPALMLPDSAVIPDQSQSVVMTVKPDGTVVPKIVTVEPMVDGLRVVTHGLLPTDRVVINGLMHAVPGTKVKTEPGSIVANTADGAG